MDKSKTYRKIYPRLLAERKPFQLKSSTEIGKRVKRTRKQEQKLITKLEEKERLRNSEYFFRIVKMMN